MLNYSNYNGWKKIMKPIETLHVDENFKNNLTTQKKNIIETKRFNSKKKNI